MQITQTSIGMNFLDLEEEMLCSDRKRELYHLRRI